MLLRPFSLLVAVLFASSAISQDVEYGSVFKGKESFSYYMGEIDGIRDSGYEMLDTRFGIRDTRCVIRDTIFKPQDCRLSYTLGCALNSILQAKLHRWLSGAEANINRAEANDT